MMVLNPYKNLGVDLIVLLWKSNTHLSGKDVVQIGLIKVFEKILTVGLIDLTDEGLIVYCVLRRYCGVYDAGYWNRHSAWKIIRMWAEWFILVMNKIIILKCCFNLEKLGLNGLKIYFIYLWNGIPSVKWKAVKEPLLMRWFDAGNDRYRTKNFEDLGKLDTYSPKKKFIQYNWSRAEILYSKVDPKKRILFQSWRIGRFCKIMGLIQYTYARIQSIIRKANFDFRINQKMTTLHEKKRTVNN
jgi:arginyl-tRNA synthetase